jgi:hypothetical protein
MGLAVDIVLFAGMRSELELRCVRLGGSLAKAW